MGPLGELGALFNPGMRHEIEERQSKENRREEEGNARDGDLRIDLASGVAVINVHGTSGTGIKGDHTDRSDQADPPAAAEPEQPSPAGSDAEARATARTEAAVRRAASRSQRKDAPADRASAGTAVDPSKPRTGQVPSSKASRASR